MESKCPEMLMLIVNKVSHDMTANKIRLFCFGLSLDISFISFNRFSCSFFHAIRVYSMLI